MTATPRAVLDAGRAERKSFHYAGPFTSKQVWRVYPNVFGMPEAVFFGAKEQCQDFIDDRVFRAMLRVYIGLLANEEEPDWEVISRLQFLAEDDDG